MFMRSVNGFRNKNEMFNTFSETQHVDTSRLDIFLGYSSVVPTISLNYTQLTNL